MASRKVDIFGSSSELKRFQNEEEITFNEYKYRCYYGVKTYHISDVCWNVCIWLTSFPSELQEMKDFRNDSTFSTYSMDIISVDKSDRIKAAIRRTGSDRYFSLEGKHLNDILGLISESENRNRKQDIISTKQALDTKTEDKEHVSDTGLSSTVHRQEHSSVTPGGNESGLSSTIHRQEHGSLTPGGNVSGLPQVDETSKQTSRTLNGTGPSSAEEYHRNQGLLSGCDESRDMQQMGQTAAQQMKPCSYKMESQPRGVCMIINNEDFQSLTDSTRLEKRHGAQQDVDKLSRMFTRLMFKVVVYRNLRDDEVVMAAKHMSLADHSEYDCFACCILSHGTQGSIYGVNHVAVPVSEVLSQFRSRACHTLAGKPKLFIIQACQGLEPQVGVAVPDTPSLPQPAKLAADGTDFLVAYSTEPGYVAFRHREEGSYFIDALVRNLEGLPDFSLHDVMAKVCDDVSQLNINDGFKQVPQFTSTLTKQLVLCRTSLLDHDPSNKVESQENYVTSTTPNNAVTSTTPTHDVTSTMPTHDVTSVTPTHDVVSTTPTHSCDDGSSGKARTSRNTTKSSVCVIS